MASSFYTIQPDSWEIERRSDGALLVRVHSPQREGRQLPDAVFTFRAGDPQYSFWEQEFGAQAEGR
jgi:hypothetical protein